MNERQRVLAVTAVVLLKAFMAFRKQETPEGDEYARRALKALRYLRDGDIERCSVDHRGQQQEPASHRYSGYTPSNSAQHCSPLLHGALGLHSWIRQLGGLV